MQQRAKRQRARQLLPCRFARASQQQFLCVVKISRACTIDDSLGPPVFADQR
jgi:hypothetical protein